MCVPFSDRGLAAYALDLRERRSLVRERLTESIELAVLALGLDLHAPAGVANPSRDVVLVRKPVDRGAKPHPLHNALDGNAQRTVSGAQPQI